MNTSQKSIFKTNIPKWEVVFLHSKSGQAYISAGCWSEDSRHWYQTWKWLVFFQQVLEWCFMIWGLSIVYVNFQTRQHQNLSDWSRPLFGRLWNENLLSKQCKISDIRHSCSCHSFTMEEQIIFNQDYWIMVIREGFN